MMCAVHVSTLNNVGVVVVVTGNGGVSVFSRARLGLEAVCGFNSARVYLSFSDVT